MKKSKYEFATSVPPKMRRKVYISYFINTLLDVANSYADQIKNDPIWYINAMCVLNLAKDLKKSNLG